MADREIQIVITGKNLSADEFEEVKKDLGELGRVSEKTAGAMDYAIGQIAADSLYKLGDIAGQAFGSMIESATEAEKVNAQLETVLKSTGGAAGVTAEAAKDLAGELAQLTLFEDDTILATENMLLTFTNINKDIFPETTKLALDMSQALGQDLKSSAIQLGKALNDPITGVTALRRVGVQFTDAQQDMIKNLVESGNLMEAQTLILEELQKEFGGSAEAAANTFGGALEQLDKAWGELGETMGTSLTQNESYQGTIQGLTDLIYGLGDAFTNLPEGVQTAIVGLIGFVALLAKMAPALISAKLLLGGLSINTSFLAAVIHGKLLIALGSLGGAIAGVTAPVWLLIAAIALLIATIVLLGPAAKKTFLMIADIIAASLNRAGYEIEQFINRAKDALTGKLLSTFEGSNRSISGSLQDTLFDVKLFVDGVKQAFESDLPLAFEHGEGKIKEILQSFGLDSRTAAKIGEGFFYLQTRIPGLGKELGNQFIHAFSAALDGELGTLETVIKRLPATIQSYLGSDPFKPIHMGFRRRRGEGDDWLVAEMQRLQEFGKTAAIVFGNMSLLYEDGSGKLSHFLQLFGMGEQEAQDFGATLFELFNNSDGVPWLFENGAGRLYAFLTLFGVGSEDAKKFGATLFSVFERVKSTFESLTTVFRNLVGQITRIGSEVVNGFYNGIKTSWETLKTNVGTLLDNLLKFVQSKLLMRSPSLVWANEVGAPMAQGVAQGFTRAMERQAAPAMSRALAPGGGAGGSSASYSVGTIQLNNPLSLGERNWVRRNQELVAERTVLRALKGL